MQNYTFTRCSLLVAKSLVTLLRFTRLSFLIACYSFHVACCSFLVACYSFLVACYSFLVACYSLIAGYSLKIHTLQIQSLLFTSCRNHSWEKITRYSLENITHYPLWNSPAWNIACLKSIKIHKKFSVCFNVICFLKQKNWTLFHVNVLHWNLLSRKFYIRRNNNKVVSVETGRIVSAHLLP